ncbi:ABC transporter permease subunit [Paenibacillus periandrae]|uniref:ABC transporter permease subunit n=1 Tax=Paenibacillus periandrae TaxID=1761741 RepID=UPI001F08DC0D|nr:ABC transporter permease subunit [Paenibacillus periandrae]
MFHKGLWFQHYKQSKYILWALWLVAAFSGFQLLSHANNVVVNIESSLKNNYKFEYNFNADLEMVSILQLLICIGLPAFLVGFNRTNQTLEYMYAMPVKREHIFVSKWMLGIVHIIGSTTVGLLIQLIVIHSTILNNYLTDGLFWIYYLQQLIILSAVFSFSLWLGFIGGSFLSQAAYSVIFLLLPSVLFGLVKEMVSLHYFAFGVTNIRDAWFFSMTLDPYFQNISFPLKLLKISEWFRVASHPNRGGSEEYIELIRQTYYGWMSFLVPLLVTLGSVWGMLRMAVTARNENNGKVLLNNKLRPYLVAGVVMCAFLFGGAVLEGTLGNHYYGSDGTEHGRYVENIAIYYAAALGSAGIGYYLIKKWLGSKQQLSKN